MYGLRKINKDGIHHDYKWPLEVGVIATAPNWNPEPICGGGLHCLENGLGAFKLLCGDLWAVIEYKPEDRVHIEYGKVKVKECKIVFLSEKPDGIHKFFDIKDDNIISNVLWEFCVRDPEFTPKIDEDCVLWLLQCEGWGRFDINYYQLFEARRFMAKYITTEAGAFQYAMITGFKTDTKHLIKSEEYAYRWIKALGDFEEMRKLIHSPKWLKKLGRLRRYR